MNSTVLIVPGLRGHVEEHWQSLLAAELSRVRCVPPLGRDMLSCDARVEAIDAELAKISGPVILVAHSAGVISVAHWALIARRPIKGALLATPADLETPLPLGYPEIDALEANGWLPLPRKALPFPSIVAASRNDPLARGDRVAQMAQDWKSILVDIGEVGHLNPASGHGAWPLAHKFIQALDRQDAFAES